MRHFSTVSAWVMRRRVCGSLWRWTAASIGWHKHGSVFFSFWLFLVKLWPSTVFTATTSSSILSAVSLTGFWRSRDSGKKPVKVWEVEVFFPFTDWKNGCGNREGMQRPGRTLPAHHERHEGKNNLRHYMYFTNLKIQFLLKFSFYIIKRH